MKLAELRDLRAVFFDLDGTLVDSAIDIYHAMNAALATLGRPAVSEAQVRCWVGRGAPQLAYCVIKHQHEQGITTTVHGSRPQAHDSLQEQQHQLLEAFLNHYERHVCVESRIYAGVEAFIQACQNQNLKLACITNKPYQPAHDLLQALDLLSPFHLLLGGDSVTHKKPHPMSLQHALHCFELEPHQALMIGDSRNDVEAAHAAGMQCVALTYGYNHGEPVADCNPDLVLDSLQQLL
ncbi:phosphoglycolate phosphatase [Alkanindiges illinoisensis]|uniref:phosphoglycolate phosphatase n=1 Tax=Alkanindiges illinoisensis TaxID=197183 RepID=UPI000478B065|nr:phosphoglycolate phosphatase [Alkanindiges illinoisensis]